jgi:beta-glucuronidase
MERIFQKSIKRASICLNGQWNVTFDPENTGLQKGYHRGENLSEEVSYVPSCWNFLLQRFDYFGVVWYSRKFTTAVSSNSRLIFHAVSGQAVVYLDGKELGQHYGSYNKFWFDIPRLSAGGHLLVVKADNTINDEDTMPLRFVDWFVWGGIYRGVELEQFDNLSIDKIHVDTEWNGLKVSKVNVKVQIKNWADKAITDDFSLDMESAKRTSQKATIEAGSVQDINFILKDFRPVLWDTDNPRLYNLRVTSATDELYERTGFRKIEVKNDKILLNGREIFIKGVNRHNDHPELGYAINAPLILRDMEIIKDLGANAIRGSHYPNDPIVLDYCDQMGLLFWEELAFWNHPADSLSKPLLHQRALQMAKEMIERDYNHPSIIFWSIQNESKSSSQEGLHLFSKIAAEMRQLDKSRLISFASACGKNDICFDLVDVVCWNMYPGWYDDDKPLDDMDERFALKLRDARNWLVENKQNKPFLVTEFGAAALLGETTFEPGRRWTENYQQKLLEKSIKAIVDSKVVQGFYIWQFCDGRTALPGKVSINRPKCFNNKGIVNEYRKPKLAYYTVRDLLRKISTYR